MLHTLVGLRAGRRFSSKLLRDIFCLCLPLLLTLSALQLIHYAACQLLKLGSLGLSLLLKNERWVATAWVVHTLTLLFRMTSSTRGKVSSIYSTLSSWVYLLIIGTYFIACMHNWGGELTVCRYFCIGSVILYRLSMLWRIRSLQLIHPSVTNRANGGQFGRRV